MNPTNIVSPPTSRPNPQPTPSRQFCINGYPIVASFSEERKPETYQRVVEILLASANLNQLPEHRSALKKVVRPT